MAAAKEPMSRADVVNEVAAKTQMSQKEVESVVRAYEDSLQRQLSGGGEVRLLGFGTFKVSDRAARMGRNPATGAALKIAASKNVRFSAGKAFKDALNAKGGSKGGAKATGAKAAAPAKAAASAKATAAPAKAAAAKSGGKSAAPSKAAASKGGKK